MFDIFGNVAECVENVDDIVVFERFRLQPLDDVELIDVGDIRRDERERVGFVARERLRDTVGYVIQARRGFQYPLFHFRRKPFGPVEHVRNRCR